MVHLPCLPLVYLGECVCDRVYAFRETEKPLLRKWFMDRSCSSILGARFCLFQFHTTRHRTELGARPCMCLPRARRVAIQLRSLSFLRGNAMIWSLSTTTRRGTRVTAAFIYPMGHVSAVTPFFFMPLPCGTSMRLRRKALLICLQGWEGGVSRCFCMP